MKFILMFFALHGLLENVLSWSITEEEPSKSICSWMKMTRERKWKCGKEQFQCSNSERCISRSWYCDRADDCGDNSDERFCNTASPCPRDPLFAKCDNSDKCIPYEWICNGFSDCPSGDDERSCGSANYNSSSEIQINKWWIDNTLSRISDWLHVQKMLNSPKKWGANVDRFALLSYFADDKSQENETKSEIAYELNIRILSQLASTTLESISSTELASYLNAFLVTCLNPRDFHGYNIVQELRNRVDQETFTNPYVLLALCNAGEILTETDKNKLTDTFYNSRRTFWTDMQAVSVMALACASKQPGNEVSSDTLRDMTQELKQRQYLNGTIDNLPTTALVMQALIATDFEKDPENENFDEMKALQELLLSQNSDGSFGDLISTIFVAPILTCRSLMHINTSHCHYESRDEIAALEELSRKTGPKKRIQYSLWIGDEKDLERNLVLRVPEDTSLYGVMETAAAVDSQFKFDYWVKDRKPYINAISKTRDNPLSGKFWFLYNLQNDEPALSTESPADIMPTENDHYVLWYRRGTWAD